MRWFAGFAAAGLAVAALGNAHPSSADSVTDRVCSGVRDCREALSAAELALESCAVSCQEEQTRYLRSRDRFRDALEQQAGAEHQADVRRLIERREMLKAKAEAAQAEQTLLLEQAREQEHQRQLELLHAQASLEAAAKQREFEEQVRYLTLLTPKQRLLRLHTCHEQGTNCDALVRVLVDAAGTAAERRALIQDHERAVTGSPAPRSRVQTPPSGTEAKINAVPLPPPESKLTEAPASQLENALAEQAVAVR
jgi:myosin heavy subunit